jgi:hypothetical protein
MCSAPRAANVGYPQQGSDEAGHPVIGVGDVVKDVELMFSMQTSTHEIGFHLPQVSVDLDPTLNAAQKRHPRGQVEIVKLHRGKRFAPASGFNVGAIRRSRENHHSMKPAELFHQVPSQDEFAAAKGFRAPARRASISACQNT